MERMSIFAKPVRFFTVVGRRRGHPWPFARNGIRLGNGSIRFQRIASSGGGEEVQLREGGGFLSSGTTEPLVQTDGADGIIIVFEDQRTIFRGGVAESGDAI